MLDALWDDADEEVDGDEDEDEEVDGDEDEDDDDDVDEEEDKEFTLGSKSGECDRDGGNRGGGVLEGNEDDGKGLVLSWLRLLRMYRLRSAIVSSRTSVFEQSFLNFSANSL